MTVVPGLFAGGCLDVMTSMLLDRMSAAIPKAARVVDFGSGSGTLAAGLQERCQAKVTLLDADAVSLEVAKRNLPGRPTVLGDGFNALREQQQTAPDQSLFDVIASNPSVHRGQPDDWRVLRALIEGAVDFLKPSGQLWLVAQEHVPVGRLFALASTSTSQDGCRFNVSMDFSDGRFTVWRADRITVVKRKKSDLSDATQKKRHRVADE